MDSCFNYKIVSTAPAVCKNCRRFAWYKFPDLWWCIAACTPESKLECSYFEPRKEE